MGTYYGGAYGACTYSGPLLAEALGAWWWRTSYSKATYCHPIPYPVMKAQAENGMQESKYSHECFCGMTVDKCGCVRVCVCSYRASISIRKGSKRGQRGP